MKLWRGNQFSCDVLTYDLQFSLSVISRWWEDILIIFVWNIIGNTFTTTLKGFNRGFLVWSMPFSTVHTSSISHLIYMRCKKEIANLIPSLDDSGRSAGYCHKAYKEKAQTFHLNQHHLDLHCLKLVKYSRTYP